MCPRKVGARGRDRTVEHRTYSENTAYLSEGSSAFPEKKVVTSRHPLLPTPWTWK
jgi:hypothetical protein